MAEIGFVLYGRAKGLKALQENVAQVFSTAAVEITKYTNHAVEITEKYLAQGIRIIIVAGGDGSINEVINGILNSNYVNEVKLGIIPMGTGNDFVRTLSPPADLIALKQAINQDNTQKIDVGRINYFTAEGREACRWFINIMDVGLGGAVAESLSKSSRRFGALITYQMAIIKTLFTYKKKWVRAYSEDFEYSGNTMSIIAANGKYFGSGLGIAPDACPTSGRFNIVILSDISIFDYILNITKVKKCKKLTHSQVFYKECTELKIETRLPLDIDGEFVGYSPIQTTIYPKLIQIYF